MKYDVIIIGAGLGGLTAGAKLSREGEKVMLIEQHDRPGGYATTFKRGGFTLEVGLHEMYGPSPGDMTTRIFNDLDVFRHVEFIRLPEFYRFIHDRVEVTIPHDPVVAAERLSRLFPGETEGIRAYFDQILKPRKKAAQGEQHERSIGEFLDSVIHDEELKLALLGNLGYYHDDPYTLSLSYYSVSQGSYYTGGACFIKGGSQKLSDHLASCIREHGGEVMLNHLVTGIRTDGDRVSSVLFQRRNDPGKSIMEASANEIIANAAMPSVAELLPAYPGGRLKEALRDQRTGASLLTLYLGFSRPLSGLGYNHYSTFVYDSTVHSLKDILPNNCADFTSRSFTFIDYGQIESGLAPAGKGVGALCCIDYLRDWEIPDKKTYVDKKKQVAAVLIDRLEKLIPGVKGIIEYAEVGTPSTLRRYTLNPGGAVYGFAQLPSRKTVDTSGLPENLHFASAWGRVGGGFSGTIYSGYLCSIQILRKSR